MAYPTLSEVKAWLGISDTSEDTTLTALLASAIEEVEAFCNTKFISTVITAQSYDGDGTRFLVLRHRPVISVQEVRIDSGAISSDLYEINANKSILVMPENVEGQDARLRLYGGAVWTQGTANIAVDSTYGYATTPAAVTHAVLELVSYMFGRKGGLGISSESLGPRSVVWSGAVTGGFAMPAEIKGLLRRYVQHEVRG